MPERDLFTEAIPLEQLADHIEREAIGNCEGFHVSFGIWKSHNDSVRHEALVVCELKGGKKLPPAKIIATSIRNMFAQVDEFFNSINIKPMHEISEATVRTVIKNTLNLKQAPMNESFYELGCSNADLIKIQQRLARVFNKTVSAVFYNDTIFSLTERLTKQKSYENI